MARRNSTRKAARAAEKAAKKNPKIFLTIVAVLLVIAIVAGVCWYFLVYKKKTPDNGLNTGGGDVTQGDKDPSGDDNKDPSGGDNKDPSGGGNTNGEYDATIGAGNLSDVSSADLSIHFLYLGNKFAGDCTLIKVGNTEVLIDAGSRQGSAGTLVPYIKEYCTDGVLEYVIATHADQDHIAAFVGTTKEKGIFESFECQTIIDFPRTDKTTQILKDYRTKRDAEVQAGAVHYTALQCWNESDGAQKSYALSETVTMSILYNYYYDNKSPDENNYSVCMLLSQKINDTKTNHYLFTGDLEEKGEEYLVQYNDLPEVELFKAGHHGSPTSSNDCLLSVIKPKIVCVCCCAGSTEYTTNQLNTFPSQAMIDRVGKYTSSIYVTTMITSSDHALMNGNIILYCGKRTEDNVWSLKLYCSNNATKLKDTEWFKANRTWNGVE